MPVAAELRITHPSPARRTRASATLPLTPLRLLAARVRPAVAVAGRLADLARAEDARGPRDVGEPARDVDRVSVPVAAARQRLAVRHARSQQRKSVCVLPLGRLDERERAFEQRVRLGRDEHRGVADQLHELHRGRGDLSRQLPQPARERPELLHRQALAELRELDEVREAHGDLRPRGAPSGELLAAEHGLADLLALLEPVGVIHQRPHHRHQAASRLLEARADLELGQPGLHQALPRQRARRSGDLRHRHPHDPGDLEQALVGQPDVAKLVDSLGGVEVGVGELRRVRVRGRQPERLALADQELDLDPGLLGHLVGRVARPVALEQALGGQQGEAVLLDGVTQLVERDAVLGELAEQLAARLPGLAARSLEQPLGLEVDRHAVKIFARPRRARPRPRGAGRRHRRARRSRGRARRSGRRRRRGCGGASA